jgi:hypothetical protein
LLTTGAALENACGIKLEGSGSTVIRDFIVSGNGTAGIWSDLPVPVAHSCLHDSFNPGIVTNHCITNAPLFAAAGPAGPDPGKPDFRLAAGSPCINFVSNRSIGPEATTALFNDLSRTFSSPVTLCFTPSPLTTIPGNAYLRIIFPAGTGFKLKAQPLNTTLDGSMTVTTVSNVIRIMRFGGTAVSGSIPQMISISNIVNSSLSADDRIVIEVTKFNGDPVEVFTSHDYRVTLPVHRITVLDGRELDGGDRVISDFDGSGVLRREFRHYLEGNLFVGPGLTVTTFTLRVVLSSGLEWKKDLLPSLTGTNWNAVVDRSLLDNARSGDKVAFEFLLNDGVIGNETGGMFRYSLLNYADLDHFVLPNFILPGEKAKIVFDREKTEFIRIFNIAGDLVWEADDTELRNAENNFIEWDGYQGEVPLSAGLYFVNRKYKRQRGQTEKILVGSPP